MKTFDEFIDGNDTDSLQEGIATKAAVVAYARKAKINGDAAATYLKSSQAILAKVASTTSTDEKLNLISKSLIQQNSAMMKLRLQLGAISAQITASHLLISK